MISKELYYNNNTFYYITLWLKIRNSHQKYIKNTSKIYQKKNIIYSPNSNIHLPEYGLTYLRITATTILGVLTYKLIYIKLKLFLINSSKSKKFVKLPLQSSSSFVTIIIGGLLVSIPSSYLSIVKNFGVGLIFGLPALIFSDMATYMATGEVSLDDLNNQLQTALSETNRLFSQLNNFINQFHNFVNQTGINVITDGEGELGIDVSSSLDDSIAQNYANRINILDSLIHNHIHSLESLLNKISELEEQIKQLDSNFISQLSQHSDRLRQLINLYGH